MTKKDILKATGLSEKEFYKLYPTQEHFHKNMHKYDLGGLISGASTGASMGSALGPWGMALGAIAGGAANQIGDIRGQNRELASYDKLVNNTQLKNGGKLEKLKLDPNKKNLNPKSLKYNGVIDLPFGTGVTPYTSLISKISKGINKIPLVGLIGDDLVQGYDNITKYFKNLEGEGIGSAGGYAYGGNMTESINAGGTHEQNPNEGVNIGNKGLVEEGEVKFNFKDQTGDNSYIFSKRLGFANKAKSIMKKFDVRPNDKMATEAKEQQLKNLMDKQEVVRSSMFDNQFKKAFGGKLKKYPWGGDWNYTKKPGEFDPTTFNINANTNPILVDPNNNSQFLQKDYIPTDPNTTSFISGFNHLLNPDVYPEGTYEISSSSLGKEQEPQVNTRFYTPKEDPTAEKNWAYLRRVDPVTMKPANMKNPSLNIGLGDNSMFGFPNAGKKIQPVSSSINIDYLGTFNKPLTNEFVGSNGPILAEKNKPLYQKPNTKADKPKVDKGYNKGLNKSGQYGQFAGALGKLAVAASGPDAVNLQRMKNHNISSLPEEIQASNELNQIYNNANRDIRNNAGSNAGSFLASRIASAGNQADKTGQVLSGIRSKYNEFNTRNNMAVDQFNTQTSHTEDDLRTREKDAVRTLLMDAASQAGNVNANINRDNMGYKNEQDLLGLMQSQDFKLEQDPKTGRYKISSKYKKGFGGFMYKSKSKKK